jgi:molybdopterin converting factor small subunit
MRVHVHLYPPLNTAAGQSRLEMVLADDENTMQSVIDKMVEQFGRQFRNLLYDDKGSIVSGWCAFINQQPAVHFNQPDALTTAVSDGDEISLLLALAGG